MACGKSFRSEAAWDSHERSKKHLKAVEALRRQMEKEQAELGLDEEDQEQEGGQEDQDETGSEDADLVNDDAVDGSHPHPPRSPTPDDLRANEAADKSRHIAPTQDDELEESDSHTHARKQSSSKYKAKLKTRKPAPEASAGAQSPPPPQPSKAKSRRRRRGASPEPFDEDATVSRNYIKKDGREDRRSRRKPGDPSFQGNGEGTAENVEASGSSRKPPLPEGDESGGDEAQRDGDEVRSEAETEAGAPGSGADVEMSKKEKRRAREAQKKARELEEGKAAVVSLASPSIVSCFQEVCEMIRTASPNSVWHRHPHVYPWSISAESADFLRNYH